MTILAGQVAMSLAVLAFAALALRVAGVIPVHARRFAYAWALTGWTFLIVGANSLFHDVFSIIAFQSGPESAAWAAVLQWHPILNHSRTFLITTYCLVLVVALLRIARNGTPQRLQSAVAVVIAGMVLGAGIGWQEDAFSGITHYSAVAVFDVMELGAIMGLLSVGLFSGAMDRSLWVSLSVIGFVVALSVLLFAALSHIDLSGQWSPRPWHVQNVKAVLASSIVLIALRHLRRVRKGGPVRALMEAPVRAAGIPSLHS
jgi:hypothetical protein